MSHTEITRIQNEKHIHTSSYYRASYPIRIIFFNDIHLGKEKKLSGCISRNQCKLQHAK